MYVLFKDKKENHYFLIFKLYEVDYFVLLIYLLIMQIYSQKVFSSKFEQPHPSWKWEPSIYLLVGSIADLKIIIFFFFWFCILKLGIPEILCEYYDNFYVRYLVYFIHMPLYKRKKKQNKEDYFSLPFSLTIIFCVLFIGELTSLSQM